jgi:hypothetical protein
MSCIRRRAALAAALFGLAAHAAPMLSQEPCGPPETETLDGPRGGKDSVVQRPGRTITAPGVCEAIVITAPGYIPQSIVTGS